MTKLISFGREIEFSLLFGWRDDGNLLHNVQIEAGKCVDLLRVVSQQPDRRQSQVLQDLKADAVTEPRFEDAGLKPFTYEAKGKTMSMRYYQIPDEAYEDPDAFRPWFKLALEAAGRAPMPKKKTAR